MNTVINNVKYYYCYAYENLYNRIPCADEILDGIFLGDVVAGNDLTFLKKHNIKYVVNISNMIYEKSQLQLQENGIEIKNVLVRDHIDDHEKLLLEVPFIVKNIKEHRRNGKVLVNCFVGRQRSAIVVACYLYKYVFVNDSYILSTESMIEMMDKIITFIRTKRPIAFTPQVNFYHMFFKYIQQENAANEARRLELLNLNL
jgi:protein-tyrosine phosphatase